MGSASQSRRLVIIHLITLSNEIGSGPILTLWVTLSKPLEISEAQISRM